MLAAEFGAERGTVYDGAGEGAESCVTLTQGKHYHMVLHSLYTRVITIYMGDRTLIVIITVYLCYVRSG